MIIRGSKECTTYADILNKFKNEELSKLPSDSIKDHRVSCPGGGMIEARNNCINIHGYSPEHGKADHRIT